MMGVYIEGLKRPEPIKDCTHRNFVDVRIFDDGTATIRTDESPFFKVYKVKSVPPHGDLIDRDAAPQLVAVLYTDVTGTAVNPTYKIDLSSLPVVIPAERSEHE